MAIAVLEFKVSHNTQELFSSLIFNSGLYGIVSLKENEKDKSAYIKTYLHLQEVPEQLLWDLLTRFSVLVL